MDSFYAAFSASGSMNAAADSVQGSSLDEQQFTLRLVGCRTRSSVSMDIIIVFP